MGVGVGCRLVGRCRARLLLSETKVDSVGAKDRETSHLPRSFRIWDWLGCRLVGKLSDIPADHRLIHCYYTSRLFMDW